MPKKDKPQRKPSIGGQAVVEGVMMKSPEYIAIAVRKEGGEIDVRVRPEPPVSRKHPWMGWPVIRGVVNFGLSLKIGMGAIDDASQMLGIEDDPDSKFDMWLRRVFGEKAEKVLMAAAMAFAVALAAGLFIVLPSLAGTFLRGAVGGTAANLLEGLLRLLIFMGYILAISGVKDIRRVFQYHGAEHKVVHCYEADQELTVENAKGFSPLHPRCGTAFLLIIMVLSIFFFSILGWNYNWLTRILSRLALLPLVAGASYEVLRLFAFRENALVRALRAPGLWLQRLTTKEPEDDMIQVAIAAFKAAQTGNQDGEGEAAQAPAEERVLL